MGTNYYVGLGPCPNACEHCSKSTRFHLGKSSVGWKFLHHADARWGPVDARTQWMTLAKSGPIKDEYGQEVTLDELLEWIRGKEGGQSHLTKKFPNTFASDGFEFSNADFF
ncbi:hypothetical protein [Streptomyces sp. 5-10]|uniref:hypothetical protein n=1 Tax=Streptomyces sp. 5-10 TaxID=878925 RepID=UPI00168B8548|nr:hypothetical protein [Streptomyces sp. 5-10]MBD3004638.1 hypothetical protein [Streptomyces sp. 5-10]